MSVEFPLERGERLLWTGRPRQGLLLTPADAFLIPFSLSWAGFAVFWEITVLRAGAPLFIPLFGALFIGMGLHLVVGRFVLDARRRANTDYAITSERVIVRSGMPSPTMTSLSLATLSDLALVEHRNGFGTISFGATDPFTALLGGAAWPGLRRGLRLESLADARQVYGIIRDARESQTAHIERPRGVAARASS